jgi:hypothetical protein
VTSISEEDIAELPDLGTKFNAKWVWRYYVKKLQETEELKS